MRRALAVAGALSMLACGPAKSGGGGGSGGSGGGGGAGGGGPGDFPSTAIFYQDISGAPLDSESDMIMSALQASGWGGKLGIDVSFTVYDVDDSVARRAFTQPADAMPDCDTAPFPVPPGGHIEGETDLECKGGGDCHLLVHQGTRLYELYQASITGGMATGGTFTGTCEVVWDLGRNYWDASVPAGPGYSRGDSCNGADAGDFPMAPLILKTSDINSGVVAHALRFTLLNSKIRKGVYVHPDTHYGGPSGGPTTLPYGARLRLKASFDDSSLSPEARLVTAALKKYGMFLADGGNIFISATDDLASVLDPGSLRGLMPSDFEMVDGGTRYSESQFNCTRTVISN